ncbi:MAG: alanine racemase [Desulforhopalus sp.]|jgi:alanine racemase
MEKAGRENCHPIWAEINCSALRQNFRLIRSHIKTSTRIMSVVKGNAYGHGALAVASLFAQEGTDLFGVARFSEAEQLRQGKISQPILIFGITDPRLVSALASNNFIQTVHSLSYAEKLHKAAKETGCQVRIHLKVDTGMGRLGFLTSGNGGTIPISEVISRISRLDSLRLEGIYTHFATCDSPVLDSARNQLELFNYSLVQLGDVTQPKELCIHASNSAALMVLPEAHFDMVRPGIMLYGLVPSVEMDSSAFKLSPAMSVKTRISQLKRVPPGFPISYGHSYVTNHETVLATVPVGYADGYPRLLSSLGKMLIRGVHANVVGRVCMDQLMLDVGHIPNVQEGDEVVVLGKQGDEEIAADELAQLTGTINYEVVSRFLARVPRVYIE